MRRSAVFLSCYLCLGAVLADDQKVADEVDAYLKKADKWEKDKSPKAVATTCGKPQAKHHFDVLSDIRDKGEGKNELGYLIKNLLKQNSLAAKCATAGLPATHWIDENSPCKCYVWFMTRETFESCKNSTEDILVGAAAQNKEQAALWKVSDMAKHTALREGFEKRKAGNELKSTLVAGVIDPDTKASHLIHLTFTTRIEKRDGAYVFGSSDFSVGETSEQTYRIPTKGLTKEGGPPSRGDMPIRPLKGPLLLPSREILRLFRPQVAITGIARSAYRPRYI